MKSVQFNSALVWRGRNAEHGKSSAAKLKALKHVQRPEQEATVLQPIL